MPGCPRAGSATLRLVALVAGLAGCAGDTEGELLEIERLAFVPRGRTQLGAGLECGSLGDLVVDRLEVSREQWLEHGTSELPEAFRADWDARTRYWPASGMTLTEARAFAAARGMRLPTPMEWMWIAVGTRGQRWPHAQGAMASVANTVELGLGRPAPVGTFENGRTPNTAIYDLAGNVWEWVEPELPVMVTMRSVPLARPGVYLRPGVQRPRWRMLSPPTVSTVSSGFEPVESPILPMVPGSADGPGYPAWAMGGSWLAPNRPLFGRRAGRRVFNAMGLDPGHRAADVGLRCVADARDYLIDHAAEWSAPRHKERLVAVGRSPSWSRYAVGLLEELAAEPDAPRALVWLLEGARR